MDTGSNGSISTDDARPRLRSSFENGRSALIDIDADRGTRFHRQDQVDVEWLPRELLFRFPDRDDEPIVGAAAEQFNTEGGLHPERYAFIVDWLSQVAARRPLRRIVDAGCGSGILTAALVERFPQAQIVAVDRSADMLRMCAERVRGRGAQTVEADVRQIADVRPGAIDAIVSRRMIHRVDGLESTLDRMLAALPAGGSLVNYSFRRPESELDVCAFERAADLRRNHPELYAAFVRAVLNAPSSEEYGNAVIRLAGRHNARRVRLIVFPFDFAFIVEK